MAEMDGGRSKGGRNGVLEGGVNVWVVRWREEGGR